MRNWECHRAGEEPGWNCAISTPDPLLLLVAPRVPPVISAVGGPGFPAHGPEHSLPGAVSVWAVPKHGLSFGFPPNPLWVSPQDTQKQVVLETCWPGTHHVSSDTWPIFSVVHSVSIYGFTVQVSLLPCFCVLGVPSCATIPSLFSPRGVRFHLNSEGITFPFVFRKFKLSNKWKDRVVIYL